VGVVAGLAGVVVSFAVGAATGASVALALCVAALVGSAAPSVRRGRSAAAPGAPAG
jgi:hypothetical protein